jgi:hypothetical protein
VNGYDKIAGELFAFLDDDLSDRSGVGEPWDNIDVTTHDDIREKWTARFAAALRDMVEGERAECAAIADKRAADVRTEHYKHERELWMAESIADAIRARGGER